MALEWYPEFEAFWVGIVRIMHEQRLNLVRSKWEIGRRILDFKEGLRKRDVFTDTNETPTVRRLLKYLAKKLGCSVSSFYQAYHFARVYPAWKDFETAEFEIKKKAGHYSNTVRKPGAQLTWHQVLYSVLRKDKEKDSRDRYSELEDPSLLEACSLHHDGYGHECDGELITIKLCDAHFLLDWVKWYVDSRAQKLADPDALKVQIPKEQGRLTSLEG